MPFLPVFFVPHNEESVQCLLKHDAQVNVFRTAIENTLKVRLHKCFSMYQKHFEGHANVQEFSVDVEGSLFLERLMQILCDSLPSLRSFQEVPHSIEAVLLWLLTLYDKPE